MTVQTAEQTGTTFKVEHSWEATTLDYLSPRWYVTQEGFETTEAAEEFKAAKQAVAHEAREVIAYRVVRVPGQVERDEFLEAEFAANRQYWADRARAARIQEEAEERYMQRTKKGMPVRVVKGRKVPVGTEGWVCWSGEDQYSRTGGYRIGIKDSNDEVHWTSADNVEVIEQVGA